MCSSDLEILAADAELLAQRTAVTGAEQRQEAARDGRSAAQVAYAQAEARRTVAAERRERLAREREVASSRLQSLQLELDMLSMGDAELAGEMDRWRAELADRTTALATADAALGEAEREAGAKLKGALRVSAAGGEVKIDGFLSDGIASDYRKVDRGVDAAAWRSPELNAERGEQALQIAKPHRSTNFAPRGDVIGQKDIDFESGEA